jgi:hypothetical protein
MNKYYYLCLLAVIMVGITILSSCDRNIEQNDKLLITEVPIDGPFCIKYLKEDTLYRIHNQNDMDALFEGYNYPLPQLDFSERSMFLLWGYCYGEVYKKEVSFTKVHNNEYLLDIDITEAQILPSGGPWVAAFYTNKKIKESDSIFVSIKIHE